MHTSDTTEIERIIFFKEFYFTISKLINDEVKIVIIYDK